MLPDIFTFQFNVSKVFVVTVEWITIIKRFFVKNVSTMWAAYVPKFRISWVMNIDFVEWIRMMPSLQDAFKTIIIKD